MNGEGQPPTSFHATKNATCVTPTRATHDILCCVELTDDTRGLNRKDMQCLGMHALHFHTLTAIL